MRFWLKKQWIFVSIKYERKVIQHKKWQMGYLIDIIMWTAVEINLQYLEIRLKPEKKPPLLNEWYVKMQLKTFKVKKWLYSPYFWRITQLRVSFWYSKIENHNDFNKVLRFCDANLTFFIFLPCKSLFLFWF